VSRADELRTIEPGGRFDLPSLRELWAHRDLAYLLVRRDIAVRYKQTAVGALWAVLQPLVLATVFTVFLGVLADVPSRTGVPYPLYAFSGLVCWLFFTGTLQLSSFSTTASSELITKIYFPRLLIPLAASAPATVDLAIGLAVVIVAMPLWGVTPGIELLALPVVFAAMWCAGVGAGLILSAANVRYRDVQLIVPLLVLTGLFVTPVMYPVELIPESLQPLAALNPMVGLMEAYRWAMFGNFTAAPAALVVSLAVTVVVLVVGLLYFTRAERGFADVI
jgi:lipopolysaccharide transport system permease protein